MGANCLHLKLGVPRWLMTTSICMGIIFLLWLCLVIPSNAPKQRVKATTPDIIPTNPKEIEANAKKVESMTIVVSEKKDNLSQDLPPAYDEVANLSVQLEPVHETKKKSNLHIYKYEKKRTIISRVITTCPSGLLSYI